MSSESSPSAVVLEMAEEFLERYRRGDRPSLKEYIDRHPGLAAEIKAVFPAMAMMENVALTGPSAEANAAGAPVAAETQFGDFRILRKIGHGGMGVVYEAEQVSLGRHVALKVLPQTMLMDPRLKLRFEREAKAAAKLHHTNIVPVFGVGEHGGQPFYAMQFINGQSLDKVLTDLRRLNAWPQVNPLAPTTPESPPSAPGSGEPDPADTPPLPPTAPPAAGSSGALGSSEGTYWRGVARLGLQAAQALDHAHRQGILHRDVKPSNLLLDAHGNVWITDFGLAKVQDQQNLTETGDVLGTLRYMPPEAFEGRADPRSDVYGLGLTLYELLALRPAYDERDRAKLLRQVAHANPDRLEGVNRAAPRDLVTIIHKAIDRDPGHRYATAEEMAEDLQRYLEDRPIRARRLGVGERVWRWCRRYPALAAATAAAAAGLLAAAALGVLYGAQQAQAVHDIREEKARADAELTKQRRLSAVLAAERARSLIDQNEPSRALLWLARGLEYAPDDAADLQRLFRTNLAALRAEPWQETVPTSLGTIQARSPDNNVLVVTDFRKPPRLVDRTTGRSVELPFLSGTASLSAFFSPDGQTFVTSGYEPGTPVKYWSQVVSVKTARPAGPRLPGSARIASFRPDGGRLLLVTEGTAATLHDAKGEPLGVSFTPPDKAGPRAYLTQAEFTPDGRGVMTVGTGGIALWDAATGARRGEVLSPSSRVDKAVLSPDGRYVAAACDDLTTRLWDLTTGQPVAGPGVHPYWISALRFSPDGRFLVTACGLPAFRPLGPTGEVRLWDAATGSPAGRPMPTDAPPSELIFSPDGRHLAASAGKFLFLWEAETGKPLGQKLRPLGASDRLRFSADGRSVVSDAWAVAVRPGERLPRLLPHRDKVAIASFSPDGSRIVTGTHDRGFAGSRSAYLWDAATGRPYGQPMSHADGIEVAIFSPDGKLVLTGAGAWDGTARLWDAASGKPHGPPIEHRFGSSVSTAAFSPDGETILLGGYAKGHYNTVRRLATATGREIGKALSHGTQVQSIAWSAEGRLALIGGSDGTAQVWDVLTNRKVGGPLKHDGKVTAAAFSPDARLLLTASEDKTARVWDAGTGELSHTLAHEEAVVRAQFSPDGLRILTASTDRTARIWSAATGLPVGLPWPHPDKLECATFSPDGTTVATGCEDGMARLWEVESGVQIGLSLPHPKPVRSVAFSPDGRALLTACDDPAARLWDLPAALPGEPERLSLWVQVQTGLALDREGAVRRLSPAETREKREKLREKGGPPDGGAADEDGPEWHRRTGMACLVNKQWASAAWHLDRSLAARPRDADDHVLRAEAGLHLRQAEQAARDLASAFQSGPAEPVVLRGLRIVDGLEYQSDWTHTEKPEAKQQRREQIVWLTGELLKGSPRSIDLLDRRGRTRVALRQWDEAEADYARAAALGPDALFYLDWGTIHARRGLTAVAAADFAKATSLPRPAPRGSSVQSAALDRMALSHAGLQAAVNDPAGYRRACEELPRVYKGTWPAALAARAWGCVLGPDAVPDSMGPVEWAEECLAQQPGPGWNQLTILGAALYRAGRHDAAVKALDKAVAFQGRGGTLSDYLFLSMTHHRLGHADQARAWLAKATTALDRPRPASPDGLALGFNWQGDVEVATLRREAEGLDARDRDRLAALDKAADGGRPADLIERGRFHANRGRWEAAAADFDRAVRAAPDDARGRLARGLFLAQRGEKAAASDEVAKALTMTLDEAELLDVARVQVRLGRWERAAAAWDRIVRRKPDDAGSWVEAGHAHAEARSWGRAAACFGEAVGRAPDDSAAWQYRAMALIAAGDREGYRRACRDMMRKFVETPEANDFARVTYAAALLPDALEDPAELGRLFDKFVSSYRAEHRPHRPAALCRAGRWDAAVKLLESGLRSTYPDTAPFTAYDWLFLALSESKLGHADRAREHLKKAAEWQAAADKALDPEPGYTGPRWESWRQRLAVQILRAEAEGALSK